MSDAVIIGIRPAAPKGAATAARAIDRHVQANFYPTPPEATRALLSVETFDSLIWEPACGQGHIARELARAGHPVHATDLNDWNYGIPGIDFLAPDILSRVWLNGGPPSGLHIVTNPPYGSGLADDFLSQALRIAAMTGGKVAMLLNLSSLAHRSRTAMWKARPPARVYAIDSVTCWPDPDRAPPRHFREHRYCWCVWTPEHSGPSALWWLSALDFRQG
ncbi:MAG: hypothetical protein ACLP7P_09695 [Rhodomicrobium sp.]